MSTLQPSRARKAVFSLILALVLAVFFELASLIMLFAIGGTLFIPTSARTERDHVLQAAESRSNLTAVSGQPAKSTLAGKDHSDLAPEVVHPFLGYVRDPTFVGGRFPLSTLGFFDSTPPPGPRSNRLAIGIFGGSVAVGLSRASLLVELLSASPALEGKKIWIRSFALGGYKQPQQLLALNYALALGEELDIVINLDGFNDVALAPGDHEKTGLSPFYPRQWNGRVSTLPSVESQRLIGEIAFFEARRAKRVAWCSQRPFSWSPTCHLLWKVTDYRAAQRLASLRTALRDRQAASREYLSFGPQQDFSTSELLDTLTTFWRRSSHQMQQLCAAQGIPYFHFLQPNQYFPGSKVLSRVEQRKAFHPDQPWAKIIPEAYPRLAQAGSELRAEGVQFHDLSMVFQDVEETLYVDTCCHFNHRGMEVMATAIAQAILQDLED